MRLNWKPVGICILVGLVGLAAWPWLVSAQTNAPAAAGAAEAAAANPGVLTFGLERFEPLQQQFLGNPIWQYLASLLYIVLAFYASKTIDWLARVWLKKFAARTETKLDDALLELLNGPIKILVFVILLHLGLAIFAWPPGVELYLHKGFIVVLAGSATYMLLRLVEVGVNVWRDRSAGRENTLSEQLFPVVRNSLKTFVVVVAVLVTLQNLGVNVTAAIASLSIGGLALGLAAQDTLANMFGAVAIFADRPFRIGDRIRLEGVDGTVESIGLRSTRVRNQDGHLVTIPNKTMGNATITNITARPNIKTEMNLGLTYDTTAEQTQRALEILREVFGGHPMTADVWISFNRFADSSLNLLVVHWWNGTEFKEYLAGIQEMNLELKRRFDAEQIEFAFPTQTLHVKREGGKA